MRIAAPKDRQYLETLNLKALQKDRKPAENQPAREFYEALQQEAKDGPLFSDKVLSVVGKAPDLPKHLTKWLAEFADSEFVSNLDAAGWNKLVKWADQPGIDRLLKDKATRSPNTVEVSLMFYDENAPKPESAGIDVGDGYHVVEIDTVEEVRAEGREMQNCLEHGDYDDEIGTPGFHLYSLRDKRGRARVTIEVYNGEVKQVVGKQNDDPAPKYHAPLAKFFEHARLWSGFSYLPPRVIPDAAWPKILDGASGGTLMHLATDDTTPPDVLAIMADKGYMPDMLAANTATPAKALTTLASHRDRHVRAAVAANPNTPDVVLRRLAADPEASVRMAIATRPMAPLDVLRSLVADDPSGYVRHEAQSSINRLT